MSSRSLIFVIWVSAGHGRRVQDPCARSSCPVSDAIPTSKWRSSFVFADRARDQGESKDEPISSLLLAFHPTIGRRFSGDTIVAVPSVSRNIPGHIRLHASDSPTFPDLENATEKRSKRRLRRWISSIGKSTKSTWSYYKSGVTTLSSEAKLWWKLRKNPKVNSTWREHKLRQRLPVDILRMLPIVANPVPPPFGLSVPLIASSFPRRFLTRQFWSHDQQIEFHECEYKLRWSKPLIELFETYGAQSYTEAKSLIMSREDQAACELCSLSRRHLLALSRSWLRRGLIRGLLPLNLISSRRLRGLLLEKAGILHAEYRMLRREDLNTLEEHELWYACFELGLRVDGISPQVALRSYLNLLETEGEGDPPSSLLLHAPFLLQWETLVEECSID